MVKHMMEEQENLLEFTVEKAGERLDKLIVEHLDFLSRVQVQILIKEGSVSVDGVQVKPGIKLRGGEIIRVQLPIEEEEEETPQPESIDLLVIYEDDDIAVIDKPAGLVMHPGVGNEDGTLVNALLARWPQMAQIKDPDNRKGIVHRLDKDTSGLIVVGKTEDAMYDLMGQFQERTVEKRYLALLERTPETHNGRIDAPIGRDPKQRKRMAVVRDGKPATTEFKILDTEFAGQNALVEFNLLTGRTHQIRVHAAFIGCPVVGDRIYGFRKQRIKMKRLFLHSASLAFDHPETGERMSFESSLPSGLQQIMQKLR